MNDRYQLTCILNDVTIVSSFLINLADETGFLQTIPYMDYILISCIRFKTI